MSYLISWLKRENILEIVKWTRRKKFYIWNISYLIIDYMQNYLLNIKCILLYFFIYIVYIYILKVCSNRYKPIRRWPFFYVVLIDFVKWSLTQKYFFVKYCKIPLANLDWLFDLASADVLSTVYMLDQFHSLSSTWNSSV